MPRRKNAKQSSRPSVWAMVLGIVVMGLAGAAGKLPLATLSPLPAQEAQSAGLGSINVPLAAIGLVVFLAGAGLWWRGR